MLRRGMIARRELVGFILVFAALTIAMVTAVRAVGNPEVYWHFLLGGMGATLFVNGWRLVRGPPA